MDLPFPGAIAIRLGNGKRGWSCREQLEQLKAEGIEAVLWDEPGGNVIPIGRKGHKPDCQCPPCQRWRGSLEHAGAAAR